MAREDFWEEVMVEHPPDEKRHEMLLDTTSYTELAGSRTPE